MPIFEYRCQTCGFSFEKLLRNQNETPKECPQCNKQNLQKLFSSFSPAASQPNSQCDSGECPSAVSGACPGGRCPF